MGFTYKPNNNTQLYLPFEGNSDDSSGLGNNGTGTDIIYSQANGKFGSGSGFNGSSSKIVLPDNASLKPTGDFTVGFWIKSSVYGDRIVFQSYSNSLYRAGFYIRTQFPNGYCYFGYGKNSGNVQDVDFGELRGTIDITNNKWHSIIIVYNGSSSFMYIDGNLNVSKVGIGNLVYNTTNYIRVGCRNANGSDDLFYNGLLDELFLDGKAWTPQEIKRKYSEYKGFTAII